MEPTKPSHQQGYPHYYLEDISPWRRGYDAVLSRMADRIAVFGKAAGAYGKQHWLAIYNWILGIFLAIALLVPVLEAFNLDAIANPIFTTFHLVCEQVPSHSFYIFGHQLALCARNLSIYSALFWGGLIYAALRKSFRPINLWYYGLLILPMALDGLTQLFGLRESTWLLRTLTGTLFGLANVWFILPQIDLMAANKPLPALLPLPWRKRPAPVAGNELPSAFPIASRPLDTR